MSAWLFPGQGAQYLGMGRDLWSSPGRALEIVEEAERISGFPLRQIALQGPQDELTRTDVLQPAVTAMSLGCAELLTCAGFCPDMVAGHSLGEFAALCAAGVLTVTDCLELVAERGRLMHAAAQRLAGGMAAVKGVAPERLACLLADFGGQIKIANYNSPLQAVVSGPLVSLDLLKPKVSEEGGEHVPLSVAGPWHHPGMASAAAAFSAVLDKVSFRAPRCPVYSNVTGAAESDPEGIRRLVREQMTSAVQWRSIVEAMFASGARLFLEVGPGKVLRGLLRQILPDQSAYRARSVENKRALELLNAGAVA